MNFSLGAILAKEKFGGVSPWMTTKRQFLPLWLAVILALVVGCGTVGCTTVPETQAARVVQVVSGQTLTVQMLDHPADLQTVRLVGLDAPDLRQTPWGTAAQDYLRRQLDGKTVGLEFDMEPMDPHGRLLAYVWQDGQLVNEALLSQGWGLAIARTPNLRYEQRLHHAQIVARALGRGIWNPEHPLRQTPSDFRRSLSDAS
jgi:micrococcal nuclease